MVSTSISITMEKNATDTLMESKSVESFAIYKVFAIILAVVFLFFLIRMLFHLLLRLCRSDTESGHLCTPELSSLRSCFLEIFNWSSILSNRQNLMSFELNKLRTQYVNLSTQMPPSPSANGSSRGGTILRQASTNEDYPIYSKTFGTGTTSGHFANDNAQELINCSDSAVMSSSVLATPELTETSSSGLLSSTSAKYIPLKHSLSEQDFVIHSVSGITSLQRQNATRCFPECGLVKSSSELNLTCSYSPEPLLTASSVEYIPESSYLEPDFSRRLSASEPALDKLSASESVFSGSSFSGNVLKSSCILEHTSTMSSSDNCISKSTTKYIKTKSSIHPVLISNILRNITQRNPPQWNLSKKVSVLWNQSRLLNFLPRATFDKYALLWSTTQEHVAERSVSRKSYLLWNRPRTYCMLWNWSRLDRPLQNHFGSPLHFNILQ